RPLHAMFLELLETLRIRRLELEDVPLARLAEAAPGPVERPAEVAPVRAHPELLPGRFVDFVHPHADRPQVGHQASLFSLARIEQTEHPAVEARRACPSELVPQRTLARFADLRCAEVRAAPIAARPLVVLVDRKHGRGCRCCDR